VNGEAGAAWLQRLPALLDECAQRWSLTLGPPFELSYNYAAPATRADGTKAVLKAGFPGPELRTEIAALRLYNGDGMVRLLEAVPEQGAFLLERLEPGTMLATLTDDEEATTIGAAIMRRLWRPAPADHPFPSVADWARGMERLRARFGGGTGPFPTAIVEEAESLFADLLASTTDPVLLHGDLHHYNILRAEREPWLAIDPKGIVGDRGYEVGMFLLNPFDFREQPNPQQIMERRVYLLAEELGIERERVRGWGVAQAVLSAWWTVEENGNDWESALFCAELLSAVKTGP